NASRPTVTWSNGTSMVWSAHRPSARTSSEPGRGSATSWSTTATRGRPSPARQAQYQATPRPGSSPTRTQPPSAPPVVAKSKYHDSLHHGSPPGGWSRSSAAESPGGTAALTAASMSRPGAGRPPGAGRLRPMRYLGPEWMGAARRALADDATLRDALA